MRVTSWWISYIRFACHVCGTPFQMSSNVSGIQDLFMRLGLAVLQKYLTGDYGQMFAWDGSLMCVTGT